jgi:hypothetical protein
MTRFLIQKAGYLLSITDTATDGRFYFVLVVCFGKRATAAGPFAFLVFSLKEKSHVLTSCGFRCNA